MGAPCFVCGLSTLGVRLTSPDGELSRVVTHCVRCRIIHDRGPTHEEVRVEGAYQLRRGQRTAQWITLTNPSSEVRRYAVGLNFARELPWFEATIEPATQCFEVGPGEQCRVPFELFVHPRTAGGVYSLIVFTARELSWNVTAKPIVVRA